MPSLDPALIVPVLVLAIPVVCLPYYLYSKYTPKKYDPKTGLGRGAPGFQTSVRKVSMPPHLAARIRAGEEVTADEVTEALEEEKERMRLEEEAEEREKAEILKKKIPENVDEDWLPEGALGSAGKGKGRRRKK